MLRHVEAFRARPQAWKRSDRARKLAIDKAAAKSDELRREAEEARRVLADRVLLALSTATTEDAAAAIGEIVMRASVAGTLMNKAASAFDDYWQKMMGPRKEPRR